MYACVSVGASVELSPRMAHKHKNQFRLGPQLKAPHGSMRRLTHVECREPTVVGGGE